MAIAAQVFRILTVESALSRLKHGFESRWATISITSSYIELVFVPFPQCASTRRPYRSVVGLVPDHVNALAGTRMAWGWAFVVLGLGGLVAIWAAVFVRMEGTRSQRAA